MKKTITLLSLLMLLIIINSNTATAQNNYCNDLGGLATQNTTVILTKKAGLPSEYLYGMGSQFAVNNRPNNWVGGFPNNERETDYLNYNNGKLHADQLYTYYNEPTSLYLCPIDGKRDGSIVPCSFVKCINVRIDGINQDLWSLTIKDYYYGEDFLALGWKGSATFEINGYGIQQDIKWFTKIEGLEDTVNSQDSITVKNPERDKDLFSFGIVVDEEADLALDFASIGVRSLDWHFQAGINNAVASNSLRSG